MLQLRSPKVRALLCVAIVIHFINLIVIYKVGIINKMLGKTPVGAFMNILPNSDSLTNQTNFEKLRQTLFPYNEHTEMSRFFINVSRSNSLSVERVVPDTRPYECRKVDVTSAALPSASVIIPMHNEPWSTLLRTLHSVINNTPQQLLFEIIVIDDMSDLPFLGKPLDQYLEHYLKVSIFRAKERLGTMKSRNLGAQKARGEVLVYLDSHTEVNVGWLEPIVWEIYKNRMTVVQPAVDTVDAMTLEYRKYMENMRGEIQWTLSFTFAPLPPRAMLGRTSTDPIMTPAIIGCCFAVDRKYYLDLGGLDEGMKTWGGEDVEFSLRVWMCGGNMKILECSRVGHVFKSGHPFAMSYRDLLYNEQRIVELWLGDYKKLFYAVHEGRVSPSSDFGDLSVIRAVQKNLYCKSFSWYLQNVFPELDIPPPSSIRFGKLQNEASTLCIGFVDDPLAPYFVMTSCWGYEASSIALTKTGFLKIKNPCMGVRNRYVVLMPCSIDDVGQQWSYSATRQLVWHDGKSCMMHVSDPDPTTRHRQTVMLMPCDTRPEHAKFTQWGFTYTLSSNYK